VKSFPLRLILPLLALLTACGNPTETRQPAADSARIAAHAAGSPADWSAALLQIVKPEKGGMLRGVRLGDPIERVTRLETGPVAEDSTTYKGFTEPLTEGVESEFADVLYFTDAQTRVTGIQVDVFLNQSSEVANLLAELRRYFTQRYGPARNAPRRSVWALPEGIRLTLSDESVRQAPGLRIRFTGDEKAQPPVQ
jgi:hypothetical protein